VLKTVQHVGDVLGHGGVDVLGWVFPTKSESVEESASPIFGDGVKGAKGGEKKQSVLASNVLDAEIVDDKREVNRASVVRPQRRCAGDGAIAKGGKVGGETVVGDATSLLQPGHPFSDFHVNSAVGRGERA
jgi:hypothetical protein